MTTCLSSLSDAPRERRVAPAGASYLAWTPRCMDGGPGGLRKDRGVSHVTPLP